MAAAHIDVVMLQEGRRRQHDVGVARGVGHELLVHGEEQVVALEALAYLDRFRRDRRRIDVLHDDGGDRRAVPKVARIAGQDRADARHVEQPHRAVLRIEPLDQGGVDAVDALVGMHRAAALVLPGAGDRRDAGGGVHVGGAVARAGEAVAEADVGALDAADHAGERGDLGGRDPRDRRRPFGAPAREVGFEFVRMVRIAGEVGAVGEVLGEEHVHDAAGERAVRAGPERHVMVGDPGGPRLVGVHDHERRAPRLPRLGDVGHDVDLGRRRIAAPDDDQVRLRHLARIAAHISADTGPPAVAGKARADGLVLPRVAHDVAQAVDPVALHQAHGAGVVVGPDRLAAVRLRGADEGIGDQVERIVPADGSEFAGALLAGALQRLREAPRVVHALGIARDLGADHARGVVVLPRASDGADPVRREPLDLQRAGRRAVVGAGGGNEFTRHGASSSGSGPAVLPTRCRRGDDPPDPTHRC